MLQFLSKKKYKKCIGCILYSHREYECPIQHYYGRYSTIKCPCGICIVKPICKDMCKTYAVYMDKIILKKKKRVKILDILRVILLISILGFIVLIHTN